MMPPQGAAARAEASATLSGVATSGSRSDEIGRLLDELAPLEAELDYDSDDASLIRVTRRDWEKARRVPAELAADVGARGRQGARRLARGARDERLLGLPAGAPARARRRAALGGAAWSRATRPTTSFLDEYEPGMTDGRGEGGLRRAPAGADRDRARGRRARGRLLPRGRLPGPATQQEFLDGVLRDFGFPDGTYRLDPTVHPFATTFSRDGHPDDDAVQAEQPARALGRRCTRRATA